MNGIYYNNTYFRLLFLDYFIIICLLFFKIINETQIIQIENLQFYKQNFIIQFSTFRKLTQRKKVWMLYKKMFSEIILLSNFYECIFFIYV